VKIFRVSRLIKTEIDQNSLTKQSTTVLLRRIYITSFTLVIFTLGALATMALYGIGPYRRQTYIPPGFRGAVREYAYRLAILFSASCDAIIVVYLTLTVRSKRSHLESSGRSNSTNAAGPAVDNPLYPRKVHDEKGQGDAWHVAKMQL
jgi:hypothetical protein